ncbi:uncharacterized protein BO97DRAFT_473250 [Aspergillus homomorphus CBS 101889]|uniref:C3H1-type domain-containing protein n=1 Tax=Aspergillus homomorphus (strain CBS 101889) TaxID=1450537 RepID=A0A395HKT5_ASPHC|nr:hypothetical protein BO97DRAFT_473250 [Aspergillus homomorphus CBS 101889]RAL08109.1 hypothetical protein BO97DRAFT_473250 [Aspergillus homomorphus CBS 101889]
MSSPIRPQFFCTRPNGTLTPLVAVDELPAHISIRGAPRVLSASETQGMTSLGTVGSRMQSYILEGAHPSTTRSSAAATPGHRSRDIDVQSALARLAADESIPHSQRLVITALLQHGAAHNLLATPPSSGGWLVPTNSANPTGNGATRQSPHFNSKKEYCSYWIRHGECDYQQQGCLYKHEMPHDLAMLEKLGLRDIPRWYRDKYNIPSLLPNGHGHPRAHLSHALPAVDSIPYRPIQYHQRIGINEVFDAPEAKNEDEQDFANHLSSQQASLALPHRLALTAIDTAKAPKAQRVDSKHISGSKNGTSRKLDLLAYDSVPDYQGHPGLSAVNGNNSPAFDFPHLQDNSAYENADFDPFKTTSKDSHKAYSNMRPMLMNPCVDPGFPPQGRFKKTQRSRRLFQPRSQASMGESSSEMEERVAMASYSSQTTLPSNCTSPASRVTFGNFSTDMAHANTCLMQGCAASEPHTRDASPSTHSSAVSSESSPGNRCNRVKGKISKPVPGAIGQKVYRQRSVASSEDDFFGLSMEEEK